MKRIKMIALAGLAGFLSLLAAGCGNSDSAVDSDSASTLEAISGDMTGLSIRPEGWTEAAHGDEAAPDYDTVFPADKVNRMKITIASGDWEAMQADMVRLFGEKGTGQQGRMPGAGNMQPPGGFDPGAAPQPGGRPPGEGIVPGQDDIGPAAAPQEGDMFQPGNMPPGAGMARQGNGDFPGGAGMPGRGGGDMTPENPMWVPATIEFNGLIWTSVGVRYKGNSSLTSGWRSGSLKLPLKLDFDEFEDEFAEIENQRFYGFKQLSLSNSFSDGTCMHDAVASDILAEAGLPSARTAYYEIIMDYGEDEVDLGLYVMIEVVDDTVIERFFGSDSGNIYEAEGRGASLAADSASMIESSFDKENNREEADWSDIRELSDVLHSGQRISDPAAWRQSLESVFDVDMFLEWLAISALIQHWDTYGSMTHNFYLYHDTDSGQIKWISWDHNQVLAGGQGGMMGRGGLNRSVSLDREEVSQNWPLIRFLLDDPLYYERYTAFMRETVDGAFNPQRVQGKCRELADLISPFVTGTDRGEAFESEVDKLIDCISERAQAAEDFLSEGR
ncbi:MAG: CotH kinase family protein [Dehalococcoidales bacterium]|nr:CotH kinase family protein [Dehalococcoidales bacterium]